MPVDLKDLKKKFDAAKSAGFGFQSWKPKYGPGKNAPEVNKIKLLSWPPDSENGATGKKVFKHYTLGPEGKDQAVCPKTNGLQHPCPVCEEIERLLATGDALDAKRAEKIKRVERYQLLVIDLDLLEKEGKKVVGIFDAAAGYARRIASLMLGDWGDFTTWESNTMALTGWNQGQNLPKKLEFDGSPKRVSLDPKEWLPLVPKLDELFIPKSYAEISKLVHGDTPDQEEASVPVQKEVEITHGEEEPGDDIPFETPAEVVIPSKPEVVVKQEVPVIKAEVAKAASEELSKPKKNLADLLAKTRRSGI